MKKIAVMLMAAFMMSGTVSAMAQAKDECLLISKNCGTEVDSIQKRIKKLNTEIKKGKRVYSAEELKKLEQKLKEADDILKSLEENNR